MGVGGQLYAPAALPLGKTPGFNFTGGWVGPRAGWVPGPVRTGAENFVPIGIRFPDLPARSESLYRLRYHGLFYGNVGNVNVCYEELIKKK